MASSRYSPKRLLREHPVLGGVLGFCASLALAGTAAGVAMVVLSDLESELVGATRLEEIAQVPMPNREMGPGEIVTADALSLHPMRVEYIPVGVALTIDELVGRTVIDRLLPGEVVFPQRLAPEDTEPGLAALVHRGQRAVAINLVDAGRVAGFVLPGDIVDVLVTFEDEEGLPAETLTLVEGVRVLAVDEKMSEMADGEVVTKPQVTLSLAAVDAERVTHAARLGKVRLTLHALADYTVVQSSLTPGRRLGGRALSVVEWRETVSFEELASMTDALDRAHRPDPVHVDPHLLRPLAHEPPGAAP
jgi:Flp pilus assembly protein CpaB